MATDGGRASITWVLGGLIALLAIGVIVSIARTGGEATTDDGAALPTGPAPPCPVGFVERLGRDARLRARLRTAPEGAALLEELGEAEVRFCFGERAVPVVADGRVLLLDEGMDDGELAARVGHLLHHVVRGLPYPEPLPPDADCDAIVEEAIAREATAYALEITLRRAFDLPGHRYEFEPAFWQAGEGEREDLVADYLRAHPDGAPNLDALVTGYRQRCEAERAQSR